MRQSLPHKIGLEESPSCPRLRESGRDDTDRFYANGTGLGDYSGNGGGRHTDEHKVRNHRAGREVCISGDALHRRMLLVHGQDGPAEVAVEQVAEEQARDRVRIGAGPDHGDRVWVQEGVQRGRRRGRPVPQRGVKIPVGAGVGAFESVNPYTAADAQGFLRDLGACLAHVSDP